MFGIFKNFVSYGKIEDYTVKLADEFIFEVPANYSHYKHPDNPNYNLYIKTINTHDFVNFINEQNHMYTDSHFLGAQGLSFVWQFIDKEKLKDGNPILGLDRMDVILANGDMVPAFSYKNGSEHVAIPYAYSGEVNGVWDPGIYLLQISKITETTRQHYIKSAVKVHTDDKIFNVGNSNIFSESESATQKVESMNSTQDKEANPNRTGRFSAYSKTMEREEAIDVYKMWLLHVRYYHSKLDALFQGVSIPTFFLPVPMELLQETPEIIKDFTDETGFIWNEKLMDENLEKYASRYYPRTGDDEEIIRGLANTIGTADTLNKVLTQIKENKENWYFEYKEL